MATLSTKRLAVPPDVLINVLDGESVLLNVKTESYYGLDKVGTRMWQVLTSSESIQAASETLLREYDVDREVLQEHLGELVQQLVDQGLLDVVDG
jgi:hypothetical protein